MCAEAVIDFPMWSKSIGCVAQHSVCLGYTGANIGEDGCPDFQDTIHQGDGTIIIYIVGVCFVWFV